MILKVDRVCKSFGQLVAVDNVSFQVEKGEVYGIAGPNGAGKSTLFNIISGIPYSADSGEVFFEGHAIHSMRPHLICRMGVARTFQRETVFDSLTVLQNVLVAAAYGRGLGVAADRHPIKESYVALQFVGLDRESERLARELSVYGKKRLMLASALATRPKMLLLDEPVAGLNHIEIQGFADMLKQISASGVTIILIEHVLSFLLSISHRVMILNEGKKLVEGYPLQIVSDERVRRAYLGGGRQT